MLPNTSLGHGSGTFVYNTNISSQSNVNANYSTSGDTYMNTAPSYPPISNTAGPYITSSNTSVSDTILDAESVISWASTELNSLDKNGIHQQRGATMDRYGILKERLLVSLRAIEEINCNNNPNLLSVPQKHRCHSILDEIQSLLGSLEKSKNKLESHHSKAFERSQLLKSSFNSSKYNNTIGNSKPIIGRLVDANNNTIGNDNGGDWEGRDNDVHQQILRKEREALLFTAKRLSEIRGESDAILDALKYQGNKLEGTMNKLTVGFMESLGVSNQTVLHIARTTKIDACIVYGGVFLLLTLMVYIWFS